MKKYFLFFFLTLLTFTGFSQDVRIVSYPYDTSLFRKHLPNKTFVISEQTNRIYRLTSLATNIQSINTCNKIEIASTSVLADSIRLAFSKINILLADTANKWKLTGNTGTNHDINFIGTTDNKNLVFKVNNKLSGKIDIANNNAFWGYSAQSKSIRATQNVTAIGSYALENNGSLAGGAWYSGNWNTAIGSYAMNKNTYGSGNVAVGTDALRESTTARNNTAVGWDALHYFIGSNGGNTSIGNSSMLFLKNGAGNTVVGDAALYQDTLGSSNTVVGQWALQNVRSGSNNAVLGANAGYTTNKCSATTLIGYAAGYSLPKGDSCVMVGYAAGNSETSTNRFYVDNQARGNLANGRANAFMYGEFNALSSLQKLTLNSNVTVKEKMIIKNIPIGTNDTIVIIEKDTIKKKLLPAASLPYKTWIAKVTFDGINNPVTQIYYNDLGSVTLTRTDTGEYVFSSAGLFTLNKTILYNTPFEIENTDLDLYSSEKTSYTPFTYYTGTNNIEIKYLYPGGGELTDLGLDEVITYIFFEIRVYN